MVPEEVKEVTEKIRAANVRYDRALAGLGTEGVSLEEIDRTIPEVSKAHQDVMDTLQKTKGVDCNVLGAQVAPSKSLANLAELFQPIAPRPLVVGFSTSEVKQLVDRIRMTANFQRSVAGRLNRSFHIQ